MAYNGVDRVLAAEGVSNFGSMLSRLAIPWLAALTLQASPAQMAFLLVADVLAAAVGALWLGAWVDRCGKRAVMVLVDLGRAAVMLLLALAAWQGWVSFALLVVAATLSGALTVAFEMARSAWMAQQLPMADLPRRNAQLSLTSSLSETAAFALGGWLYQGLGAVWSLAVDAVSYGVSALLLRKVPEAPAQPVEKGASPVGLRARWQAAVAQASAGVVVVASNPVLKALALVEALGALSFALTGTAYTLYVTRELQLGTGQLGTIAALGGLGAALGAWLAPRLGARWGAGRTMALGLLAFAVGGACIPLAQGLGWWPLVLLIAHQVVGDAGHAVHDVHDRTLRQTAVAPTQLARADAGVRVMGQFALLLGAGLGGVVGTHLGLQPVLWLAVVCAGAAALVAATRLTRVVKTSGLS
jgi:MFS family permease